MLSGKEVYIVMGASGSYSDRSEVVIGVFSDNLEAEKYLAEEAEFKAFINPLRESSWRDHPHKEHHPKFEDGPEWGYVAFKKAKVAPLDTPAEWLVKVAANKVALDRRKPIYNKWQDDMTSWTLSFWTAVYEENPKWQHRLKDGTGTRISWGYEEYWIIPMTIDELVGKKT